MERVEELRQEMKEAMQALHNVQETKWQFLQDFRNTVMENLVKEVSDNFRNNLENYLEKRNENLQETLKNMDECLQQASIAHTDITAYRLQFMQACNHNIEPVFTSPEPEGPILINGEGIKDLENVSSEAGQCVMQANEVQDEACTLINTLWESIPQMIDTMISEAVVEMKKYDEGRQREAEEVWQRGSEELNKAVQVLESMEKVKQQIEVLCRILRKPDN